MNKNNYNNGYNNIYEGREDYGNQNGFYANNNNYEMPVDIKNNIQYEDSNWSLLNQTGYGGNNMEEFLASDYGHYENDAGYLYNDYYGNEYSYDNNLNNYIGYSSNNNNGYSNNKLNNSAPSVKKVNKNIYNNIKKDDVSLSVISNKINANVDEELLYDSLGKELGQGKYGAYSNCNPYENKTVAIDIRGKNNINYALRYNDDYDNDYDDYDEFDDGSLEDDTYSSIDTDSSYYNRDGVYDNKMLPTQDLVFDDIYLVRNQLYDDEEKIFSFNDIISLGICVAFAIIIAFLIIRFVAQITVVNGHSMEYNFHDKEIVVLDKLSYRLGDPKRFDVVVFPVKKAEGYEYYIKRIIGLPGEKVFIDADNSQIYIDGKRLETDVYAWEPLSGQGKNIQHNDVVLGIDEYYCMGDNRNNSQDSRASAVGSINREDFLGKAIFKVSPLSSFGLIDHFYNHDIRSGKKEAYDFYVTDTN